MNTDKKKIKDLIMKNYHRGHEIFDGEYYRPILHDRWRMCWINREKKIDFADKETYISWYQPELCDTKLQWKTKILKIDIEGNLAIAKIKIFNQVSEYMDYFQFIRSGDQWMMVNKISERLKIKS
jgi:hypothetical protein